MSHAWYNMRGTATQLSHADAQVYVIMMATTIIYVHIYLVTIIQ